MTLAIVGRQLNVLRTSYIYQKRLELTVWLSTWKTLPTIEEVVRSRNSQHNSGTRTCVSTWHIQHHQHVCAVPFYQHYQDASLPSCKKQEGDQASARSYDPSRLLSNMFILTQFLSVIIFNGTYRRGKCWHSNHACPTNFFAVKYCSGLTTRGWLTALFYEACTYGIHVQLSIKSKMTT